MNGPDEIARAIAELSSVPPVAGAVEQLAILPGRTKSGESERFDEIILQPGEVVCVVGATGSGKSRLLSDIDWLAQGDTPTGRSIRVNGAAPDLSGRYSGTGRLVAELSQNMNFVMDATVETFLALHAESRGIAFDDQRAAEIVDAANELTGEPLGAASQLTELSGGQSRALMIADTAHLCASPIILIDEIENAGINRRRAIATLQGADKIVLVATHDPMLALSAPRRLIMQNGGISEVRTLSEAEERLRERLLVADALQQDLRAAIRSGLALDSFESDARLP